MEIQYASFLRRFSSTLLNLFFIWFLAINLIILFFGVDFFRIPQYTFLVSERLSYQIINMGTPYFYLILSWMIFSTTLGNLITKTKIVDETTLNKISIKQALIRLSLHPFSLLGYSLIAIYFFPYPKLGIFILSLPLLVIFYDIYLIFKNEKKQTLHDKISKTIIIKK